MVAASLFLHRRRPLRRGARSAGLGDVPGRVRRRQGAADRPRGRRRGGASARSRRGCLRRWPHQPLTDEVVARRSIRAPAPAPGAGAPRHCRRG
jgi:hypothetical protein